MTVTLAQLRDFSRTHPAFVAVRLSDLQALPTDHRRRLIAGLDDRYGVRLNPVRWTLTGPDDPDNPAAAADVILVACDHRIPERVRIAITAAVASPGSWDPGATVDEKGNTVYTTSNAVIYSAVQSVVEAELNARHPQEV